MKQSTNAPQTKDEEMDLVKRKGLRVTTHSGKMSKAESDIIGEMEKSLVGEGPEVGDAWYEKFYGTPYYVDALQLCKRQSECEAKREDVNHRYPWQELDKMGAIGRLKVRKKMDAEISSIDKECNNIAQQKNTLVRKLLDYKIKVEKETKKSLSKADNTVDLDIEAGYFGVEGTGGQMAMRVKENPKCAGCLHYHSHVSVCQIGLVPSVCGDGTYPEIGFAPVIPNRIAAKNWTSQHKDAVALPAQAEDVGYDAGEVPYRVEVLGDSALALSERMTLLKAAVKDVGALAGHIWHHRASPETRAKYIRAEGKDPDKKKGRGKGRPPKAFIEHIGQSVKKSTGADTIADALTEIIGAEVVIDPTYSFKSDMTVGEFAAAMGTTEDIVRAIATKLGDKYEFAKFIKSKLPDIMMAHGLDEAGVNRIFNAAKNVVKGLSLTEWETWKGVSFDHGVHDEDLARAISERGILDMNAVQRGGIIAPADPVPNLPHPEPVQQTTQYPVQGFVGGNLHLADSMSYRPKG